MATLSDRDLIGIIFVPICVIGISLALYCCCFRGKKRPHHQIRNKKKKKSDLESGPGPGIHPSPPSDLGDKDQPFEPKHRHSPSDWPHGLRCGFCPGDIGDEPGAGNGPGPGIGPPCGPGPREAPGFGVGVEESRLRVYRGAGPPGMDSGNAVHFNIFQEWKGQDGERGARGAWRYPGGEAGQNPPPCPPGSRSPSPSRSDGRPASRDPSPPEEGDEEGDGREGREVSYTDDRPLPWGRQAEEVANVRMAAQARVRRRNADVHPWNRGRRGPDPRLMTQHTAPGTFAYPYYRPEPGYDPRFDIRAAEQAHRNEDYRPPMLPRNYGMDYEGYSSLGGRRFDVGGEKYEVVNGRIGEDGHGLDAPRRVRVANRRM